MTRGRRGKSESRQSLPVLQTLQTLHHGEAEVESAAENLELADAMAIDLDEPGRFGEAQAAAQIAPVVDAKWQPRARGLEQINALVDRLPEEPGVYVMRDRKGVIVYIGKARRLRARVKQYFNGTDTRHFVPYLANLLGDIETVVTSNDKEALLLENNLIKKHKPRFNVKLRDDKQFLVLRLDPKASWPRLELVRRMRQDGAQYFGPYHSANSARHTLRVVNRYFKLRTCTDYTLDASQPPVPAAPDRPVPGAVRVPGRAGGVRRAGQERRLVPQRSPQGPRARVAGSDGGGRGGARVRVGGAPARPTQRRSRPAWSASRSSTTARSTRMSSACTARAGRSSSW